jgi:hypothetical protein
VRHVLNHRDGEYSTIGPVAALSWTIWFLAHNPQAQQRLYDEVDALGGAVPTFDDLDRLRWARACFDEGQRLQDHPFLPRFAMIDDSISGYRIRRGNLIGISPYTLHRCQRWWGRDPNRYDPMRFYDKDIVAARPNLAFLPFGAGPHRCSVRRWATCRRSSCSPRSISDSESKLPPAWLSSTIIARRGRGNRSPGSPNGGSRGSTTGIGGPPSVSVGNAATVRAGADG